MSCPICHDTRLENDRRRRRRAGRALRLLARRSREAADGGRAHPAALSPLRARQLRARHRHAARRASARRRASSMSFRSSTRACCSTASTASARRTSPSAAEGVHPQQGRARVFFETRDLLKLVRDTYNRPVEDTEMEVLRAGARGRPARARRPRRREERRSGCRKRSAWWSTPATSERRPTIFTTQPGRLADNTEPNSFTFQLGLADPLAAEGDVRLGRDGRRRRREVGPHASTRRTSRAGRRSRRPRRRTCGRGGAAVRSSRPGPRRSCASRDGRPSSSGRRAELAVTRRAPDRAGAD